MALLWGRIAVDAALDMNCVTRMSFVAAGAAAAADAATTAASAAATVAATAIVYHITCI